MRRRLSGRPSSSWRSEELSARSGDSNTASSAATRSLSASSSAEVPPGCTVRMRVHASTSGLMERRMVRPSSGMPTTMPVMKMATKAVVASM
ncbi:hypothetical protein FGE12_12060 [Aggregicoccus sp. 17bor-14]|nr:hypothetical protein [Aggregicoccus sp. 17bor-14]